MAQNMSPVDKYRKLASQAESYPDDVRRKRLQELRLEMKAYMKQQVLIGILKAFGTVALVFLAWPTNNVPRTVSSIHNNNSSLHNNNSNFVLLQALGTVSSVHNNGSFVFLRALLVIGAVYLGYNTYKTNYQIYQKLKNLLQTDRSFQL